MYSGIFKFLKLERESFPVVFSSSISASLLAAEQYFREKKIFVSFFPLESFTLNEAEFSDRFQFAESPHAGDNENYFIIGKRTQTDSITPVDVTGNIMFPGKDQKLVFLGSYSGITTMDKFMEQLAPVAHLSQNSPANIVIIIPVNELNAGTKEGELKPHIFCNKFNKEKVLTKINITLFIQNVHTMLQENNARNIGRECLRSGIDKVIYFFDNQYFVLGRRTHEEYK